MIVPGHDRAGRDPEASAAATANLEYNNAIPLLMNKYLPNGMLGHRADRPAGVVHGRRGGERLGVQHGRDRPTSWSRTSSPGQSDECYVRFGRIATVGGIVDRHRHRADRLGYDNIMNYIQALFSIFNAPLFATFIIGMFWKRMTPWAGFWGLVAGTVAAAATLRYCYKTRVISLRLRPRRVDVWGAGIAFVVDGDRRVGVTLFTQPKPVEELQGLVHGMANVDEHEARRAPRWCRNRRRCSGRRARLRRPDFIFARRSDHGYETA